MTPRKSVTARTNVPARTATLVAVDGVSGAAVTGAAARLVSARKGESVGISRWDASGIFTELEAREDAERPSARTLLLLYAADLAFRLHWDIRPGLAEGRPVIAAPYVDTAIALGRASGLDEAWLRSMFDFAPVATERRYIEGTSPRVSGDGFIEFACRRMARMEARSARQDLLARMHARLKATRHRQ